MSGVAERFSDPEQVARYAEGPPRYVPGFADMQRMARLLMAERAPADARVLVLGAGGGLELAAFAGAQPGWRFDGVDPSAAMVGLARRTTEPFADRIALHRGLIDDAPPGPFDAASCLLTLHFLDEAARRDTLRSLRARLRPGAPFVAAHMSFDRAARDSDWFDRYVAFALSSGAEIAEVAQARAAVSELLHILSPERDEALLGEAGFSDVALFYAGFTWRGWVAYA